MALTLTTAPLNIATNSTAAQVALSGQAHWLYLTVETGTYGFFSPSTSVSTGTGTGLGMYFASGTIYTQQLPPGEVKYFYHVATAAGTLGITEVF